MTPKLELPAEGSFTLKFRQEPVKSQSWFSRLFNGIFKQITFKRVLLALLVLPLLFYVYREVRRDTLVIEPFTVPKPFEDAGITPDVVASRISDAVRQIEKNARTRMKKDELSLLRDEGSPPDVEIPGTTVGLKTLVDITRAVLTIYPKHASGDIVVLGDSKKSATDNSLSTVTVYITQGRERTPAMVKVERTDDIDILIQDAARMILEQVSPYILAAYLAENGNVARANEILQHIVDDPSDDSRHRAAKAAALNLLGVLNDNEQKNEQKYDEAIALYQKATVLEPDFPLAYANLANDLRNKGIYDEAEKNYKKATDLNPKLAPAFDDWGESLVRQKRYSEAAAMYEKALDADPTDRAERAAILNNWGDLLEQQKKFDDAAEKYQEALKTHDPSDRIGQAAMLSHFGNLLYEQGKYTDATVNYQKAVQLDKGVDLSYENWCKALLALRKYKEAKQKCFEAQKRKQMKGSRDK